MVADVTRETPSPPPDPSRHSMPGSTSVMTVRVNTRAGAVGQRADTGARAGDLVVLRRERRPATRADAPERRIGAIVCRVQRHDVDRVEDEDVRAEGQAVPMVIRVRAWARDGRVAAAQGEDV